LLAIIREELKLVTDLVIAIIKLGLSILNLLILNKEKGIRKLYLVHECLYKVILTRSKRLNIAFFVLRERDKKEEVEAFKVLG
jgi:hypothetical protein